MKVLIINSVCGIKSTGRICAEIADDYIKDGNQCMIAYGREKPSEDTASISYRISTEADVRINGIIARLFDSEGLNAVRATKKFLKWADNYNPDVLWLHNLHGYYINIELLFDWIKKRPDMEVFWTLHDCWPFTGHCAHFTYVNCMKWKDGCNKCPQKCEYPASILFDNSKRNYIIKRKSFCGVNNMTLVTPSEWLKSLVSQGFLNEYPVKVVNNKINTDIFKPTVSDFRKKYNLNNKIIILGVASAWNDKKGLNDFIKLNEMLKDNEVIVLVGLTEKQKKSIPSRIIAITRTDSIRELAEIYTAADVFLNLTYEDTYPTVNLEAQACNTPCITYNTGGSVESVQIENIVEAGNINAALKRIRQITAK